MNSRQRQRTPTGPRPRRWLDSPGHLHLLHRGGAVLLGLGLWVFGILGLVNRLEFFSTQGQPVLGLSSNGLLSVVSLVVGAVLIAAGATGGRRSSSVTVLVGVAFMASGFANALVMGTAANLLAFRLPNVIFSEVAGGVLVILGSVGRFTSRLPSTNPYQRQRHPVDGVDEGVEDVMPTVYAEPEDVVAVAELAEAERAVARHDASPVQARGVEAAAQHRRGEDRVESWRREW